MDDEQLGRLEDAVMSGDVERTKRLLEKARHDPDLPVVASHRLWSPGNDEIIDLLLQYGADIGYRMHDGDTALHEVVKNCLPHHVRSLIQRGADVNARDGRGWTPLDWVAGVDGDDERKIVDILKGAGADYTIVAAANSADLEGVRTILRENPRALAEVQAHRGIAFRLASLDVFSADPDNVAAVFEELFNAGLELEQDDLDRCIETAERGGRSQVTEVLRKHRHQP